jgi:hypothetical protein
MLVIPRDVASAASVDASQNQTKDIGGFAIALMVVALICIVIRFVARKLEEQDLQRDDWLFLAGGVRFREFSWGMKS